MNTNVYVFLADGFEEIEATTPIDILRRAGCKVTLVSIKEKNSTVVGSHNITVIADKTAEDFTLPENTDLIFFPGGGLGTQNLSNSKFVQDILKQAQKLDCYIAAICAAPTVLHKYGLLKDKKVTAFPGVKEQMVDCNYTGTPFEVDGKIVTGRSAGVALPFAKKLATLLVGDELATKTVDEVYPE